MVFGDFGGASKANIRCWEIYLVAWYETDHERPEDEG